MDHSVPLSRSLKVTWWPSVTLKGGNQWLNFSGGSPFRRSYHLTNSDQIRHQTYVGEACFWGSTTPSTQGAGPQRSQLLETPLYMPIYLLWHTAIKFRKMTKLGEFLRTPAPKYARILQPRATKFGMITHLGKRHIQGQPCPTTQRVAVWAPTLSIFWWPLLLGPTYAYTVYDALNQLLHGDQNKLHESHPRCRSQRW